MRSDDFLRSEDVEVGGEKVLKTQCPSLAQINRRR